MCSVVPSSAVAAACSHDSVSNKMSSDEKQSFYFYQPGLKKLCRGKEKVSQDIF